VQAIDGELASAQSAGNFLAVRSEPGLVYAA
jgi:hypothetical protein